MLLRGQLPAEEFVQQYLFSVIGTGVFCCRKKALLVALFGRPDQAVLAIASGKSQLQLAGVFCLVHAPNAGGRVVCEEGSVMGRSVGYLSLTPRVFACYVYRTVMGYIFYRSY